MSGPSGPCGVWQLPQLIGPRTRYAPRSTGVSAQAIDAARQSATAQAPVLRIIGYPPRPRRLASRSASGDARTLASTPKPVNAMPDPAVSIAPVRSDAGIAAAAGLARAFFDYLRATYHESRAVIDAYLVVQDFEGQLAAFRDHFTPPHGECMLARLDGAPVGVVMLKPYDTPGVCELNRMFVAPAARGRGVGRALCAALLARARALGYREVRLDALNDRVEALPLYRSLGFRPDPDPPANARDEPGVISLRMPL
jgi:GNAT superfamily N-acetyltransferase